jgi:hypothetical protein
MTLYLCYATQWSYEDWDINIKGFENEDELVKWWVEHAYGKKPIVCCVPYIVEGIRREDLESKAQE